MRRAPDDKIGASTGDYNLRFVTFERTGYPEPGIIYDNQIVDPDRRDEPIRAGEERSVRINRHHVSVDELREYWAPISPMPYVERGMGAGRNCFMVYGKYDPTMLPELTRQMLDSLRRRRRASARRRPRSRIFCCRAAFRRTANLTSTRCVSCGCRTTCRR